MKCCLCGIVGVAGKNSVCAACRLWMEGESPTFDSAGMNCEIQIYRELTPAKVSGRFAE